MLIAIAEHFSTAPILTVTDSWFGNNDLWKPVYKAIGSRFNILSRLRCNNVLYDRPEKRKPKQRGGIKSTGSGSRYFCESLFWASQPKQAAKT
ncbi:hypothetical protein [Bathymodiolus japonicus methanotrophic gill symbiont]|uniref:hypothetical protein n=1 Tax=Bathymodiolus japonicus methanotrophic gill symbiont TaxID=113269 RepID=UPI001C8DB9CC|nr:hypothetical protein [Bathymodiolus japonicus methanotrophic gill symbiont]